MNVRTVLLLGKTGGGKSTLANVLINRKGKEILDLEKQVIDLQIQTSVQSAVYYTEKKVREEYENKLTAGQTQDIAAQKDTNLGVDMAVGAASGAAAGSVIPVVGTVVGGLTGAAVGLIGGVISKIKNG